MRQINRITIALEELGDKLVKCNLNCDGTSCDPDNGVIPRSLIFEQRNAGRKVIVVGLNPGKCKNTEKKYYLENGISYQSLQSYFLESNLNNRPYFKKTRALISLLGFDGDILWTDLAKCQCSDKNGKLPIQTLRVCINKFLRKELDIFNAEVIFTLGNDAFNFCALSFDKHFVIGLPHPSGSWSARLFAELMQDIENRLKLYKSELKIKMDNNNNKRAIHLSTIKDPNY